MLAKNHFDDCPYNCNVNGLIFDDVAKKMVPCPHCSEKKKKLMIKGCVETVNDTVVPLSTVLGIESEFLSTKFVYDSVVPDGERLFIDKESIDYQSSIAEQMYLDLSIGNLPKTSMCFGLGIKGRIDRFVYPMLAKAYLAGLTVSKFLSCSEYSRLVLKNSDELDIFYTSDLSIMLINEGCTLGDLACAKGLMQSRALKGKPTVFVTTWTIEACSGLIGYSEDNTNLFMAKGVFLVYKSSKNKKQSNYINQLLGVENDFAGKKEPEAKKEDTLSVGMEDLFKLNSGF